MARRTKLVIIETDGRDIGKGFLLTEKSADAAEQWAAQAFLALARGGNVIPDDAAAGGLAGVASMGINKLLSGVKWEDLKPLVDSMFECVQFVPDPVGKPQIAVRLNNAEHIEEVSTRLKLRMEIINLHLGFSLTVAK